jgi:ubiquinone/menaquinone biosynthesis C-methylase UbiE
MTPSAPPRDFYDGETLHIRCYDSMHQNVALLRGDLAFYEALARRGGGPVLEIGIGTGRVGVHLAQAGLSVTGLDLSPEMLSLAARRAADAGCDDRLTLVQGDMRDFTVPAPGSFGAVIVPFRAFQVLLTPQDQRAALGAFRRHLCAGGLLAVHLFDPNLDYLQPDVLMQDLHGIDVMTGREVEAVMQEATFDYVAQVRRDRWRYRAFDSDGTIA